MTELKIVFPALYQSANYASNSAQKHFWWTLRSEYFLLFLLSLGSSTRSWTGLDPRMLTLVLIVMAGLFVFKIFRKIEQDWYRCRALAESVKTSTWRFSMRSHPFEDAFSIEYPKSEFRNLLRDILKANSSIAESLHYEEEDQITSSMLHIRSLPLKDRLKVYVNYRIDDQRSWYARKSRENKDALRIWFFFTVLVFIFAAFLLNAEYFGFNLGVLLFDPLIVIVTSIVGWIQIKRHSELMASYNLTAHEIGIIRGKSEGVSTEQELSDFVNEAELAFSREHTQWVARRNPS